jgi:hypothetical protein
MTDWYVEATPVAAGAGERTATRVSAPDGRTTFPARDRAEQAAEAHARARGAGPPAGRDACGNRQPAPMWARVHAEIDAAEADAASTWEPGDAAPDAPRWRVIGGVRYDVRPVTLRDEHADQRVHEFRSPPTRRAGRPRG